MLWLKISALIGLEWMLPSHLNLSFCWMVKKSKYSSQLHVTFFLQQNKSKKHMLDKD